MRETKINVGFEFRHTKVTTRVIGLAALGLLSSAFPISPRMLEPQ